jgi:hypothetical protein
MGSRHSSNYGGMIVNFEKPYYYPGELIRGNIFLNMISNLETKGLELTIEVIEHASFFENETHTNTNSNNNNENNNRVLRTGNNILFKNTSIMYNWNNNLINIGQYAYPFQFPLPNNLPGSFEYYDGDCSAYIKYIVTAKALSFSGNNDIYNSNILIVRQSPQFFSYPNNLSDTKNISTWCFFKKGLSTLNVSYPKNFFSPDESVQVICNLNNSRCTLNANCFKLQLIQRIHLKTIEGTQRNKYLSRIIAETRVEGIYV